ncbi:MAG TPA: hypothetical protein VGE93_18645, partial [Bryobacteraceae bacterium]
YSPVQFLGQLKRNEVTAFKSRFDKQALRSVQKCPREGGPGDLLYKMHCPSLNGIKSWGISQFKLAPQIRIPQEVIFDEPSKTS